MRASASDMLIIPGSNGYAQLGWWGIFFLMKRWSYLQTGN
jgi:hypothetical protein